MLCHFFSHFDFSRLEQKINTSKNIKKITVAKPNLKNKNIVLKNKKRQKNPFLIFFQSCFG